MRVTENLSLEVYDNREDGSVETGVVANSNASNFEKIDTFAKDVGEALGNLKDNIQTIHGLHATKTGELVTVDDADVGGIFKKITVHGVYEQFATTGKNLLKLGGAHDTNVGGVSVDVDTDGTVTLNGTLDMNGEVVKNITLGSSSILSWESGKRCNISVWQVSGSATLGAGTGNTFAYSIFSQDHSQHFQGSTTDTNLTNYKGVDTAVALSPGVVILQLWRDGTKFDNFKFRLQVETGTLATSYEPYTGGKASPCLDYPQEPEMLKDFSVKISGSDTSKIDKELTFDLPEDQSYLAMLPDTTRDTLEVSADGSVDIVKRVWHKHLKIGDMNNLVDYPGWSLPKSDELMSFVNESSHTLVSSVNSIGVQFTVNTVGDTIRLFAPKESFGGLTQLELIEKYPDLYVDIYGKIETEEVTIPVTNIDPVLVPESNMNIWVESEMQTDVTVDYPRDINIIINKIEEKLASIS